MVNEGVFELRVESMMKRRAAGGQRAQFTKSTVFGCWHKASIDTQVQTKSSKVAKYQVPMYPCTYYPASHRPPIRYLAVSRLSFFHVPESCSQLERQCADNPINPIGDRGSVINEPARTRTSERPGQRLSLGRGPTSQLFHVVCSLLHFRSFTSFGALTNSIGLGDDGFKEYEYRPVTNHVGVHHVTTITGFHRFLQPSLVPLYVPVGSVNPPQSGRE